MLYQLDLLFKNCKRCSHNSENGSPEIRCQGCSFYPQIRWIGEQLGRGKQVAVLTLEEYQDYKAQGMTDTQIAIKVNTLPQYISKLKRKWSIQKEKKQTEIKMNIDLSSKQANTETIGKKECACKGKEINAKYEQEITNLKASCEDLENENAKLRESKNDLLTEYNKLQEAVYNNSYLTENQKKRIEDLGKTLKLYESENKALRELVRLWV
jgi:chromosome segregation ATPase